MQQVEDQAAVGRHWKKMQQVEDPAVGLALEEDACTTINCHRIS